MCIQHNTISRNTANALVEIIRYDAVPVAVVVSSNTVLEDVCITSSVVVEAVETEVVIGTAVDGVEAVDVVATFCVDISEDALVVAELV